MLVLRPSNPRLTRALAMIAVEKQSFDALRAAGEGPCVFVGFLQRQKDGTRAVVDGDGRNPGPLQEGDILTSRHELRPDADKD